MGALSDLLLQNVPDRVDSGLQHVPAEPREVEHRLKQQEALTVLAVVGDLHLALLRAQQRLGHLGHRVSVGELAVQEVAGARLLHDVRPGEARHLAEAVVTVDDSTVLHAGIGYDEFLICGEVN